MAERRSALEGHYQTGRFGIDEATGLKIRLERALQLQQVSWWPGLDDQGRGSLLESLQIESLPMPGCSVASGNGQLLRIEPLKCWIVGDVVPSLKSSVGATLDLSHSRTRLDISGEQARLFLNRLLPLDLRNRSMPAGAVASSAMHHVGVSLWRLPTERSDSYALFVPRGFAVSVWEILLETAMQFGVEVT